MRIAYATAISACGLFAVAATAQPTFQVAEVSTPVTVDVFGNPSGSSSFFPASALGDTYFHVPGIGSPVNFSVTGTYVDSVFDTVIQVIGTDAANAVISSNETQSPLVGTVGNFDVSLSLSSSSGELFPSGFAVGGVPATTAAVFLGANAGGNPLNFAGPATVNTATISLLNAAGTVVGGPFDISTFAVFTAGPGGTWLGSYGVTFGAGSTGRGIASILFETNVTVIPEPATAGLLGLAGLGLLARRRRA